jgi:hypothetical protein
MSLRRRAPAPVALLAAVLLIVILALAAAASVSAASPDPTPATGVDPRSSGQGPGLVGDPATAIGAVLLLAAATIGATRVYLHFTDGRRDERGRGSRS